MLPTTFVAHPSSHSSLVVLTLLYARPQLLKSALEDVQPSIDDCKKQVADLVAAGVEIKSLAANKGKGKQRASESDSDEDSDEERTMTDAERVRGVKLGMLSNRLRELHTIKHRACFFLCVLRGSREAIPFG